MKEKDFFIKFYGPRRADLILSWMGIKMSVHGVAFFKFHDIACFKLTQRSIGGSMIKAFLPNQLKETKDRTQFQKKPTVFSADKGGII
jgi:hypothetical protein